jgi:hypothetical protein
MKAFFFTLLMLISACSPSPPVIPPSPEQTAMNTIRMVNATHGVSAAQFEAIVAALQIQLDRDFSAHYFGKHKLVIGTALPNASSVTITDGPIFYEATRVSGYHSIAKEVPFAFATTIKGTPSLILGHELLEMLADPDLNGAEIVDKWVTRWYYINGLPVVDFALPDGTDFCSLRAVKCVGMAS